MAHPDISNTNELKRDASRLVAYLPGWSIGQKVITRPHHRPRRFQTWLELHHWLASIVSDIVAARARREQEAKRNQSPALPVATVLRYIPPTHPQEKR